METTACQPKVSRPLHLPRCSIRHGWLFSMSCQSRVRPGFTAVITIVGIYTTAPLFQTRRLVAGRQAAETLAAGHGCTGRRPPSLMMQQQTLPLLLPRQTDREREKGPWTEQPHGLTSNNLPPTRPPTRLPDSDSVQLPRPPHPVRLQPQPGWNWAAPRAAKGQAGESERKGGRVTDSG